MNFEPMRSFMDRLVERGMPGNAVSIYKDGVEVFKYQSGYSDLENKIPTAGNELLYIYSCSKPLTATAALQLYEKGFFLLVDPDEGLALFFAQHTLNPQESYYQPRLRNVLYSCL